MKIEDIKNKELLKKIEELKIKIDNLEDEDSIQDAVDDEEERLEGEKKKDQDVDYWKEEARKAFEQRDAVKKDKRSLKKQLDKAKKESEDSPDEDEFESNRKELDDLRKEKTKQKKEAEDKELEEKSDLEKSQIRHKKDIESLKDEMQTKMNEMSESLKKRDDLILERDTDIKTLRKGSLGSELMRLSVKYSAYNPNQIVKIMTDDFEYDEDLERYIYPVKDEKGKLIDEKTIEERVKEFLGDPDNNNLVESKVKSGTGHKKELTGKKTDESSRKTFDDKYDPNDDKIKKIADEKGLTVDEHIEILEKRDARLSKINEKKEE